MSENFVEIPDQHVRPGGTVRLPRDSFAAQLRLGDRMRFERAIDGRIEILEGMVVDLDEEKVEIDLPIHQRRFGSPPTSSL
jgi:hypothetical protein